MEVQTWIEEHGWEYACETCRGEGVVSRHAAPGLGTVTKRTCRTCGGSGIDPSCAKQYQEAIALLAESAKSVDEHLVTENCKQTDLEDFMGYVQANLLSKENVIYEARVHPAVFMPSVAALGLGVGMIIYAISLSDGTIENTLLSGIVFLVGLGFFFTMVFTGIQALLIMLTTEFAVTNQRVIAKTGLVRRSMLEMRLAQIESLRVRQSILGRLLNFGTVTIIGTGGTRGRFVAIAQPFALRKQVNEAIG